MTSLDDLSTRQLQLECTRALQTFKATNANLAKYNKLANHDSQQWYRVIIAEYITTHGGLPSKVGPGTEVQLVYNV